jgi:hypothetical protein
MRRNVAGSAVAIAVLVAAFVVVPLARADTPQATQQSGTVYARVTASDITLGNATIERRWSRSAFATTGLTDKRPGGRQWAGMHRDFTLRVASAPIGSETLRATDVTVQQLVGGLRLRIDLAGVPGLRVTRIIEAYDAIAGFRTQTLLRPTTPLALSGYTLDEVGLAGPVRPTIHALRAGADWREPGWTGPQIAVGDPHAGTWRESRAAARGAPLTGAAQWVSGADDASRSLFMVMERVDLPSSRASYDGTALALDVDLSRDVISLGPFEEQIHVENPKKGPARQRVLAAGKESALEAAFTGVATGTADEPAQLARYLQERRLRPYRHDVVFNSNGTDADRISTGAKDDMDIATVREVAPIARSLGVETFVLDDGWQAASGDWYPDSPQHPEPRWDGTPDSKFKPRFPDAEFRAVREAIAPMRLGLWMSPMHFNPASATFKAHPEWACAPVGDALALYNAAQPDSGSNEAGLGTWGPNAIPHVESRIRDAIEHWGVQYFKFDFLVWLDCAGQGDMYAYRDAFVGMLDRLGGDYPGVTFQIDETNDYRLFPFESVTRGPSWFQNGSPGPQQLLHNLWNLSPFVPTYSIGQHALGGKAYERFPVATLMAAAMPSHITFFSELRGLPSSVIAEAAPWLTFYREHRELLGGMAYPLLSDPLAGGWTALQPWDAVAGQGSLLVFRQRGANATQRVALRNIPPGRSFDLIEAPSGATRATVTSAQLTQGIDVTLAQPDTATVLLVVPAGGAAAGSTFTDAPASGEWLAGDFHVHTCYSHDAYCGPGDDNTGPKEAYTLSGDVDERFLEGSLRGLDFLAITDHNDTRSVTDPGFATHGLIGVPGYENSLHGHAQMLGATSVFAHGDSSAADVRDLAARMRAAGGIFQINHPADGVIAPFSCAQTGVLDWGYGYDVQPDTLEVWNIQHYYQPPFPAASSNAAALAYWECWLERGARIGATGGSDSHWLSTSVMQGPGNPTTWIDAGARTTRGILDALRAGRTSVSVRPPVLGGAPLLLEADADGDGEFEAMQGDTVPPGALMRVRSPGMTTAGLVDVRANGADVLTGATLVPGGEVRFRAPATRASGWVRATLSLPDAAPARMVCEPVLGTKTTYCRAPIAVAALTSPIYLAQ